MPNVAKVLKEEIARIGRREAKAFFKPLRKRTTKAEKSAAEMKRRLNALEKAHALLQKRLARLESGQFAAPPREKGERSWITGKGIRSLRRKLSLSQAMFARLAGVSSQAVYNWEKKSGLLRLRAKTKASIFSLRGIGAREAKKRLKANNKG